MLRLLSVVMVFVLCAWAWAGVSESKEWIVGRRQHGFVKVLSELGISKDHDLEAGQVLVTADMGGAFTSLYILGPVKGNAREYAEVLDAWAGGRGEVVYSHEDDFAAARWERGEASFLLRTGSQSVDLQPLRDALLAKGLKVVTAVRVMNHAAVSPVSLRADRELPSSRYYVLPAEGRIEPVTVSAVVEGGQIWGALFVFVIPELVALLGFGLAYWYGRQGQVPLEQRRKVYGRIVKGSGIGAFLVATPFAIWFLTSRQWGSIADLWMGTRSVSGFIPLAMLPILTIAAPGVKMIHFEQRLFGTKDPEAPDFIAPSTHEVVKPASGLRWVSIGLHLAFLAMLGASIAVSEKQAEGLKFFLRIGGFAGFFGASYLARWVYRKKGEIDAAAGDEWVVGLVRELEEKLRVRLHSLRIHEPGDTKQNLTPFFMSGNLGISRRCLVELPEDELRFALAYTLAGDAWRALRPLFFFAFPLAMISSAFFVLVPVPGVSPILFLVGLMLLSFPILLHLIRKAARDSTTESIVRAVRAGAGLEAGERYFAKVWGPEEMPDQRGAKGLWEGFERARGRVKG